MSFWGLCSAWPVPLRLQSDSLFKEFNLHHTPHWSTLPFYQSILIGNTPTDFSLSLVRNASQHLSLRIDSSGEGTASLILFHKHNIILHFLWLCTLYIVPPLGYWGGQMQCQNYLTHQRADFDPVCQPTQRYPSSLSVRACRSQRRGCVRKIHHHNWTWNAISLLATKVQVDWGLSLQILISCVAIGEHGLSSWLEMMLSLPSWQLKSVYLAPLLCPIMVRMRKSKTSNMHSIYNIQCIIHSFHHKLLIKKASRLVFLVTMILP